jgi:hypothetical protein
MIKLRQINIIIKAGLMTHNNEIFHPFFYFPSHSDYYPLYCLSIISTKILLIINTERNIVL